MRTNKDIEYEMQGGRKVKIPKGTGVHKASNLPSDNSSGISHWAKRFKGMDEYAKSHHRTYGFGVGKGDVESRKSKSRALLKAKHK